MIKITKRVNSHLTKKQTILGIFAHPDDESFGPGATLAKYAAEGHEVQIITVTRGQAGQTSGLKIKHTLGQEREEETRQAAKILGIGQVTFLDFFDGTLNEHQLPTLKTNLKYHIRKINPEVIIIYNIDGISWHLDHIAVAKAVIQLYDEGEIKPPKIYFFGYPQEFMRWWQKQYHRVLGCGLVDEKLTLIDVKKYINTKITAMRQHRTQKKDWQRLIALFRLVKTTGIGKGKWGYEYFQLARSSLAALSFPEKDLLVGLS